MSKQTFAPSRANYHRGKKGGLPRGGRAGLCRVFCALILIAITANQSIAAPLSSQSPVSQTSYANLGLEATNWITSFQVTPVNDSWGIPYWNQDAWGLDPYYFANGTITAGTGNILAGDRQELSYLVAGHDAGEGAYASLLAYLETHDPRYLNAFNVYLNYFESAQIPGPRTSTPGQVTISVDGNRVTINDAGFWAEQATVSAGTNGTYGAPTDKTTLQAVFPAAEHGNPIAIALIAYYRLTHDQSTLSMLNRYGNWLVRDQIRTGNYSGAFPVTQYYYYVSGWKPRMYETTESAWVLAELYLITGNQTYLNASEAAGRYMLFRQFVGPQWIDTPVYGALPYESNETHYTQSVSTNHAGYTILAWSKLFQITGDTRYLNAAERYADWLLSFQITDPDTVWGNHTYANDSMAVGGFYYGYNVAKHEFGWRVAESLWSASDAIPALLMLSQITGNDTYRNAAILAATWLTKMKYPDQDQMPLQALAIIKFPMSSGWGPFPQFYQPDMRQLKNAGIIAFVKQGRMNVSSIMDRNLTWFERTFSLDFNILDYQMASQGPTYMKMVWSWWPSIGFEPRYGGDIAFGAFATDGYLTFNSTLEKATEILAEVNELTGNSTNELPANATAMYLQARALVASSVQDFNTGWYSLARAQADEAADVAGTVLSYTQVATAAAQNKEILFGILGGILCIVVGLLVVSNLYWYRKFTRKSTRARRRTSRR